MIWLLIEPKQESNLHTVLFLHVLHTPRQRQARRELRKCLPQQDPPPGEVSHYPKPGSCPVPVASTTTNKRYRIEGSSGPDPDHNGRKEHQHGIECHPVLIPTITDDYEKKVI